MDAEDPLARSSTNADRIATELFRNRLGGQFALASAIIRAAGGLAFLYFGMSKLTDLPATKSEFYAMGFSYDSSLPFWVGLLETVGGLMLIVGLGTRLISGLLALDMVGACLATVHLIALHLGQAGFLLLPGFLLIVMVFVLWAGPAAYALDNRLAIWLATRFGLATGATPRETPRTRRPTRSVEELAAPPEADRRPQYRDDRRYPGEPGYEQPARVRQGAGEPLARRRQTPDEPMRQPARIGRVNDNPDPPTQPTRLPRHSR